MTKAELRARYLKVHEEFEAGRMFANEYALHLEDLLSDYCGLRSGETAGRHETAREGRRARERHHDDG
jgi:hypothetical protein